MTPWVIRDPASLQRLRRAPRNQGFRLQLPGLSSAENLVVEGRLRELGNACGCAEGAIGLIAGALVSAVLWVTTLNYGVIGNASTALVCCVTCSALGKGYGLWRSRLRFRSELRSVMASIQQESIARQ